MTSRDSDQRYLAATAWLAPGQGAQGDVVAVMAAASDASLQLLAFHVRHSISGYPYYSAHMFKLSSQAIIESPQAKYPLFLTVQYSYRVALYLPNQW